MVLLQILLISVMFRRKYSLWWSFWGWKFRHICFPKIQYGWGFWSKDHSIILSGDKEIVQNLISLSSCDQPWLETWYSTITISQTLTGATPEHRGLAPEYCWMWFRNWRANKNGQNNPDYLMHCNIAFIFTYGRCLLDIPHLSQNAIDYLCK